MLSYRNGIQEEAGDLLKSGNHLLLSHRQHLNGVALMLTYPRPIDFLNPMGDGILARGIGGPEQLIGEGFKIDRRTIRSYQDDRVTVAKRIGPTGSPIVLDGSLLQDGGNVL